MLIYLRWQVPAWSKDAEAAAHAGGAVHAPMHGKVLHVAVKEGDAVKKGQALVILEAMKMEHAVLAGADGVVRDLKAFWGAQVAEGKVLMIVE